MFINASKEGRSMITVDNLSMHYGPVIALYRANFTVQRGEVVGLLGPNGAGKSTTMKILTTYLYPTAGTAVVDGQSVLTAPLEVRKRIGYLPEILPLYPDMEVRTYLDFVGQARGLRRSKLRQRLDWVVQHCGLKPMYRKLIRELSKGYRQRVGLAQALLHDPQVVILDEPTSGLDPHQILEVRHLLRDLAQEKTVLLSTHILQEVEATADRIVIINGGQIVGNGTLAELQRQAQRHSRTIFTVAAPRQEAEAALREVPQVARVHYAGSVDGSQQFEIEAASGATIGPQLGALARTKGWQIGALYVRQPTLEETFLALTEAHNTQVSTGV
jgi:ABC-2 type transport system ATP-binding protein